MTPVRACGFPPDLIARSGGAPDFHVRTSNSSAVLFEHAGSFRCGAIDFTGALARHLTSSPVTRRGGGKQRVSAKGNETRRRRNAVLTRSGIDEQ
jgi:hypothetical protein